MGPPPRRPIRRITPVTERRRRPARRLAALRPTLKEQPVAKAKKELASVIGFMMLQMIALEAVVITLAALLPDGEIDHVQAALDAVADTPEFRREDKEFLSVVGDTLITRILQRRDEVREG
jgi:hypothetical protein